MTSTNALHSEYIPDEREQLLLRQYALQQQHAHRHATTGGGISPRAGASALRVPPPMRQLVEQFDAMTPMRQGTFASTPSSSAHTPSSAVAGPRDRSPRVAREPSPSHSYDAASAPQRVVVEGVSVKNMPYDYVAPSREGGDLDSYHHHIASAPQQQQQHSASSNGHPLNAGGGYAAFNHGVPSQYQQQQRRGSTASNHSDRSSTSPSHVRQMMALRDTNASSSAAQSHTNSPLAATRNYVGGNASATPPKRDSESPTRKAMARARDASGYLANDQNFVTAHRQASDSAETAAHIAATAAGVPQTSTTLSGVSVKNQSYDFVAPHDDKHQRDFKPSASVEYVVNGGALQSIGGGGGGNSPNSAGGGFAAQRRSRSPSHSSVSALLRNAVADASAGRVPHQRSANNNGGVGATAASGVSVRDQPYDFVGPVCTDGAAGEFVSHEGLTQPPITSSTAAFYPSITGAQRGGSADEAKAPSSSSSRCVNQQHDFAEAVEEGSPDDALGASHATNAYDSQREGGLGGSSAPSYSSGAAAYRSSTTTTTANVAPTQAAYDSRQLQNVSPSRHRAGSPILDAIHAERDAVDFTPSAGRAPSLTRMVADLMVAAGPSIAPPLDLPGDMSRYAEEALARAQHQAHALVRQHHQHQQQLYRDPSSALASSSEQQHHGSTPASAHHAHHHQQPSAMPRHMSPMRSPAERPHVDICQVVSTVPVEHMGHTGGRSAVGGYVSPRRNVVSSNSVEAQTLLDTARTTVAMLTEELVGLRREHAALQKAHADQARVAATAKKASQQALTVQQQLDAVTAELAKERHMRQRAEDDARRANEKAAIAAANEAKMRRDRTALVERLTHAEQEVVTVKVTAKAAIDQLAAALAAVTEGRIAE